jgi:hypothetical protein
MVWLGCTFSFTFTSSIVDTLSTLTQESRGPTAEVTVLVKSRETVTYDKSNPGLLSQPCHLSVEQVTHSDGVPTTH